MHNGLSDLFSDEGTNLRAKVVGISILLIGANAAGWLWALTAFHDYPILLETATLAYTFGLRHAFDADHIAAIDNVTRKLMQEGKRPVAVGFFFSLGHSTIVVALSITIAITATALQSKFDNFTSIGGIVGTIVAIDNDTLVLRVKPDNLKLQFARSSVTSKATATPSGEIKK